MNLDVALAYAHRFLTIIVFFGAVWVLHDRLVGLLPESQVALATLLATGAAYFGCKAIFQQYPFPPEAGRGAK